MKIYIYLFNKFNTSIGIYEFIKPIDTFNINDSYKTSVSRNNNEFLYGMNYNSSLSLTIEGIEGVNIVQNKTIYRKTNKYSIVYIKISGDADSINVNQLNTYFKEVIDSKIIKKINKKYIKYNKNIKNKVNSLRFKMSLPSVFDFLFFMLSISAIVISLAKDISSGSVFFSGLISSVSFLKILFSITEKVQAFNRRYIGTNMIVSNNKEIHNNIINNRTNEYKDFKCDAFNSKDEVNPPDIFMFSDKENENLRKYASTMSVSKSNNKVPKTDDSKNVLGYVFSSKVKSGKVIYDSKLCGIDSELNFYNNKNIKLKKVSYYDYVSNDEIIYNNFTNSSQPKYYLEGYKYTLYPNGGFKNIESSSLSNLIGINIICLLKTNDKTFVLVNRQCTFSDVNHSKFVPSGSGSLEYKDFIKNKKGSFEYLLKYGMLRELEEESFIDSDFIKNHNHKFSLLGVARLFSKSGKPDFFGMIELEVKEEEIDNILNNYNEEQNKIISINKGISNLESTYMSIIEYNEFIKKDDNNNLIYNTNESLQLRYTKYLLDHFYKK